MPWSSRSAERGHRHSLPVYAVSSALISPRDEFLTLGAPAPQPDRAQVERVGNLHVQDVIFRDQATRAEAVGRSDILHQPGGCLQRLVWDDRRGPSCRVGAFVIDFGRIDLEDQASGYVDEQKAWPFISSRSRLSFLSAS